MGSRRKDMKETDKCKTEGDEQETETYAMEVNHNPSINIPTHELLPYGSLQLFNHLSHCRCSRKFVFILQIHI